MILSRLRRMIPKRRRTIVTVAGTVLVALLVAAYGIWSVNAWNSYEMAYQNWQKGLRMSVDAAITLPATTSVERTKKMIAFRGVTGKIDSAKQSLCRISSAIAWQHVMGDFRQHEEECGRIINEASAFGKNMQATTNYLKSEQAVAAAVGAALATSEGKVTEETWGAQIATWQKAERTIAQVPSAEPFFAPVKTAAMEKVKLVGAIWQDLIAAHTTKDKTKYGEAQARLIAAYTDLSSVSTISAGQLSKLAIPLQSSYSELFHLKA